MRKLRVVPFVAALALVLASCVVYQGRTKGTGLWTVFASQEQCVKAEGVIGDTDNRRPFYMANGRAYYSYILPIGNWDCALQWGRPAGYVAARFVNYKWIPEPVGEWAACTATDGWNYSTEHNTFSVFSGAMEPIGVTYPPCGPGWYGVSGCGAALNGTWGGGCVGTDPLYLPG